MSSPETHRPEMTELTEQQRDRVARSLRRRRSKCGGCGSREFRIGDALYLGFLFLHEDTDAYMVALTCTNSSCPTPYTGITLKKDDFLFCGSGVPGRSR